MTHIVHLEHFALALVLLALYPVTIEVGEDAVHHPGSELVRRPQLHVALKQLFAVQVVELLKNLKFLGPQLFSQTSLSCCA